MSGTPTDDPANEPTQSLRLTVESLADGRYELGGQLGAGGMGIVRRARDHLLERDVAVKLLADNLAADPDARRRFLRESRAAAQISHPHVVSVHDVGEEAGRPYFVMELVDGPSLADVLHGEGPLPGPEVARIAIDALRGISRAHEHGLIHRDIKPGNLLLTSDGAVKVTDLGVVASDDDPQLTRTGFVVGSRSYLAPERRRGEPATVQSDLYALGATLIELLTGEPPAPGSLPTVPGGTPAGLRRLLPGLLAEHPAERPSDAMAALAVLAGQDADTGAATSEAPVDRRGARVATAVGGLAVVLALTAGLASLASDGAGPSDGTGTEPILPVAEPDDGPLDRVPRAGDDPARTAENLAGWLRQHTRSDPGSQNHLVGRSGGS
jgi:eukaryotic-like serine/threonine-protein kinase